MKIKSISRKNRKHHNLYGWKSVGLSWKDIRQFRYINRKWVKKPSIQDSLA